MATINRPGQPDSYAGLDLAYPARRTVGKPIIARDPNMTASTAAAGVYNHGAFQPGPATPGAPTHQPYLSPMGQAPTINRASGTGAPAAPAAPQAPTIARSPMTQAEAQAGVEARAQASAANLAAHPPDTRGGYGQGVIQGQFTGAHTRDPILGVDYSTPATSNEQQGTRDSRGFYIPGAADVAAFGAARDTYMATSASGAPAIQRDTGSTDPAYQVGQQDAPWATGSAPASPLVTAPQQPQQQPNTILRGDYIPPTHSAFETAPGFDQAAYREAYINQQQNDIRTQSATSRAQLVHDLAQRNLSPDTQQALLAQFDAGFGNQLGTSRANATAEAMKLGQADTIQRAGQEDNYALARGGFGISYANQAALLPGQVQAQTLDNQIKRDTSAATVSQANTAAAQASQNLTESQSTAGSRATIIRAQADQAIAGAVHAGLDNNILEQTTASTIAGAQVSLAMAQTALAGAQAEARMNGETFDERLAAKRAELKAAIAQGRLSQWESENAGWLAVLKFGGNVVGGAIQAAAGAASPLGAASKILGPGQPPGTTPNSTIYRNYPDSA